MAGWGVPVQSWDHYQGQGQDQGQGGGWGGASSPRRSAQSRPRGRWVVPSSSQPYEVKLPHFIESIAECEDNERKTSIITVDKRDDRIVSPFQAGVSAKASEDPVEQDLVPIVDLHIRVGR